MAASGSRYTSDQQPPPSVEEYVEAIVTAARAQRGGDAPLLIEPGRALCANSTVTLYTVESVKQNVSRWVAVDGGMSDNLRPMLYGSRYEAHVADRPGGSTACVLAGKHCESGDVIVREATLDDPRPGDVVVTPATGAYGYAMANNYNGVPAHRSSSATTGTPAWWCGARASRICSAAMSARPYSIGLLGHGTVGGAFDELLAERAEEIERFNGRRPVITGVLTRSSGHFEEVLAGADLLVELMGGLEPAREYLLRAMRAGKDVVTANKQLLSQHGEELFETARAHDVRLRFEAAVAGAVPVVRVLEESLSATPIERIHGIVNGTTNFILTRMARGSSYEEALAEAQRVGYAEADPSDDVSGRDAAAKMAILARLAFGSPVHLDDVRYEGIDHLQLDDLEYARELGLGLKLIGTAERREGGLSVRVYPTFLYGGHPLATIPGPFNAVTVESETITELTMSGPGAGGRQTASAVLGDVVSVMTGGARPPAPPLALRLDRGRRERLLSASRRRRPPGGAGVRHEGSGRARCVDKVGRPARHGRARAARDGYPSGARVAHARGRRRGRAIRLRALAAALNPRHRRGVPVSQLPTVEGVPHVGTHVPLIERFLRAAAVRAGRPARQPAGGLHAAAARAGAVGDASARAYA